MSTRLRSLGVGYGVALVAVVAAFSLRFALEPLLGGYAPFVTFFAASMLVAWLAGIGPALVTLALGTLLATYFLVPPPGQFSPLRLPPSQLTGSLLYLVTGILVITLLGLLQRSRQRAELNAWRFRRLLNAGTVGFALADKKGRIDYANPALRSLLGYAEKAVADGELRWDRITPPGHAETTRQLIATIKATHAEADSYGPYEQECTARDGQQVPVLVGVVPLEKRPDGINTGVLIVMDLSRIKATEAALRRTQERCRVAAQTASLGLFDFNLETGEEFWSEELKILFGLSGEAPIELDEERLPVCFHPEDRERVLETVRAAMDPGGSGDMEAEHRIIRPDGTVRWVLNRSKVSFRGEGQERRPVRHIGALIDISDRKRLEEALRDSERQHRQLVENLHEGIWMVDPEGVTTFVNQRMADMLGYRAEEMLGRNVFSFLDETGAEATRRNLQRRRQGIREEHDFEFRRKDGARIFTRIAAGPIYDAQGHYRGALAGVVDITHRKRMEDDLRRINRQLRASEEHLKRTNAELQQFASIASHDLKAPLRAVHSLSSWIEEEMGPQLSDEGRHYMDLLRERVRRMDDLINALLDYSRAGGKIKQLEPVDTRALVQEIAASQERPAAFRIAVAPDLPSLVTDRLHLRQVFANLIGNAVKYHDRPDGRVTVTARDLGDRYEFAIADDGPGIPPDYRERVFNLFQRGPGAEQKPGTGIGLAVVRKVVETAGGQVVLESAPGRGSTFRFTWPKTLRQEDEETL